MTSYWFPVTLESATSIIPVPKHADPASTMAVGKLRACALWTCALVVLIAAWSLFSASRSHFMPEPSSFPAMLYCNMPARGSCFSKKFAASISLTRDLRSISELLQYVASQTWFCTKTYSYNVESTMRVVGSSRGVFKYSFSPSDWDYDE